MALSNSQYNGVMREYEERQLKHRHERDRRVARLYEAAPEIQRLDQEITAQAARCARLGLAGDKALEEEKNRLQELRRKRRDSLLEAGFPEDYTQMAYDCPDCKDTGYINGKRCHCFERARLRILYAQSGIEEILKRENFSTLTYEYYDDTKLLPGPGMTELQYMRRAVELCQRFAAEFPKKRGNLLLTGSTGVGKTFLTNCIARELIDAGVSVIYLSSQDLFELFSKSRFGREREEQEEAQENCRHILECELLVIDDLGTEINNSFVSSQLFYCINERINQNLGTIISTNLSIDLLRDSYSDRVASRIMSHYTMVPLYGADIRMKRKGISGV